MNLFKSITERRLGSQGSSIDWVILICMIPILLGGIMTMYSFSSPDSHALKQTLWIIFSIGVFIFISKIDTGFIKIPSVTLGLYIFTLISLFALVILGKISHGASSWFDLGFFSFQPSDFAKIVLIIILAKYFSRRHIEIRNVRHIFISGIYAFVFFILILAHPDLGSASIIFLIWFGMILVSGLSKKHLFGIFSIGLVTFLLLWNFGFREYQKDRIRSFVSPLTDIHGAGYNAYQSKVAIGSGEWFGKGLGYGTQSRLKYLPEYQTDFVFAAFAEEWGFVGVFIMMGLFAIIIFRILMHAMKGQTNFEILFGIGTAIYFIVHIFINVGMNVGILPVTGTPLPFMSYGGTHILSEFIILGILMSQRRHCRIVHKDLESQELLGPQ
jgi:rod shape determining protein RodA